MATEFAMKAAEMIADPLIEKFKNDLTGQKYGEATEATEAIFKQIEAATSEIKDSTAKSVEENEYDKFYTLIQNWTDKLHQDQKSQDEAGLTRLKNDIDSTGETGLDFILKRMHGLLVGTTKESDPGLIRLVAKEWESGLASEDMDKTIPWYLQNVDDYLVRQVNVQNAGLALQMWSAKDKPNTMTDLQNSMKSNLEKQLQYAYNHFPSMIKAIKPSYKEASNPWQYWKFITQHTAERLYVVLSDENQCSIGKRDGGSDDFAVWRFASTGSYDCWRLDEHGIVRIANRANTHFLAAHFDDGGLFGSRGWVGSADYRADFPVKIAPQAGIDSPNPCLRIIPKDPKYRNLWPYGSGDIWRLDGSNIQPDPNDDDD